ncbi:MAG: tryptophan-rich sensory protein [Clostridia bacterium]|nr:tryptophan-rich sensory protein [Clostridia bacterium]
MKLAFHNIRWKPLCAAVAIPLGVGALSSLLTKGSMEAFSRLRQPPLSPPDWVFPVVWSGLYVLMGTASYLVNERDLPKQTRMTALTAYGATLVLNFLWPLLFFRAGMHLAAFILLVITYTTEVRADLWTPADPTILTEESMEDHVFSEIKKILRSGDKLFSGKTNRSYKPSNTPWLMDSSPEDILAILYTNEVESHAGWNVGGISVEIDDDYQIIARIDAATNDTNEERLLLFTIQELMDAAGVNSPVKLQRFKIETWNGGRIAGAYYMSGEAAEELRAYLEEAEKLLTVRHDGYTGRLSNPNATQTAQQVYDYLREINGKACLTAQMEVESGHHDRELEYLYEHTGRLPAIRGLDFINNDFEGVTCRALEWWEEGGIPMICWHTGPDFKSGLKDARRKNIDWTQAFRPTSKLYKSLVSGMDRAAPYLHALKEAGVVVLWRPFHEADGGWFWWGKGGGENFRKLWRLMYTRYTEYWGLDNLIWVLGYSSTNEEMKAWYPGDDYVDVIGADSYKPGAHADLYQAVTDIAPEGMPVFLHECGTMPTEEDMKEENAPWALFMIWHRERLMDESSNSRESLYKTYNGDYFITLDELPAFGPQ